MKFPKVNLKSIIFYYSLFFSTLLIIGGFYSARSAAEVFSNLLFLPIGIFFWIKFIENREIKKLNARKEEGRKTIK